MKILVIEDSPRLLKSLVVGMTRLGHTVISAADGKEGLALALDGGADIVILDIMLPKLDGLTVLSRLREVDSETSVILLTAKDQIQDRVSGLDRGADDYLCKPFSFSELEARINAINRRAHVLKSPRVEIGETTVNLSRKEVWVNGEEVYLTRKEYLILEYLVLSRSRVVTYENLESLILDTDCISGRNTIEAHVSAIRKKLRKYSDKQLITTKRGFGYMVD